MAFGDDLIDLGDHIAFSDQARVPVQRTLSGDYGQPGALHHGDMGVASGLVQGRRIDTSDLHGGILPARLTLRAGDQPWGGASVVNIDPRGVITEAGLVCR